MTQSILFINLPIREQAPPNNCPLGVISLATHLREKKYYAQILDLNIIRPFPNKIEIGNLLKKVINEFDIFGLSGLITTLGFQEQIAKIIRKLKPSAKIIAGGGFVTDIGKEIFEWIPELDSINIGPGELTIEKSVGSDMKIHYGCLPKNLDDYSFDYSLIDVDKYIHNPIWGDNAKNSSKMHFKTFLLANIFGHIGGSLTLAYVGSGINIKDPLFYFILILAIIAYLTFFILLRKRRIEKHEK